MFAESRIALLALLAWLPLSAAQASPAIETWDTPNGARVLFVAAPTLPMVDVQVVFDAGSARDGARPGLASLTAAMLTQGAGDWDADAIAERLDDVGASLDASVDRDMASVAGRSLTNEPAYGRLVETMAEVLAEPTFAEPDLERLRENRLISLRRHQQDPGTVGQKAIYRLIFGDHPYAADPSGTAASIAALAREDLVAFHHRYYVAENAVVAIVGALDRQAAEALADRLTAGLPRGEAAPTLPPVADPSHAVSQEIPFPSSQAHVYIGQPGMRRGDPDYFPLYVGNHILGGSGLVSLLSDEVREKRGLSYSVYSYFLPLAERGPFLMGLQTKAAQAAQAEEVLRATLGRFITEGPSDEELTAAGKNITGGFPLRIASNGKIVQYLAVIGFYRLPLDHLSRFNERVSAVTAAQIQDAFARRVHPDRLAVVTVGPPGASPDPEATPAGG
ncbi:putative Zn-dependent peptidase [Thioflavicoccus mobilis 8321]|uniref:Putative Zn-dependent peptidase n=1 Tax=Thioflavicoccus mobilis 8321 TaxID=765912 RepID=L0H3M8_9GAMM|nr:pitrilysin family protein [Thioflavicoccus mobilis]AGA92280.1 putative Zn-dependent peptidase [Thioflavicoccus mobilis 8321]